MFVQITYIDHLACIGGRSTCLFDEEQHSTGIYFLNCTQYSVFSAAGYCSTRPYGTALDTMDVLDTMLDTVNKPLNMVLGLVSSALDRGAAHHRRLESSSIRPANAQRQLSSSLNGNPKYQHDRHHLGNQ